MAAKKEHAPRSIVDVLDVALAGLIIIHVIATPFTKVEESFNVQALHDLLYHRFHLSQYDHFEFPGVVPRTFLGAISVALLSSPIVFPLALLGFPRLLSLYIVRSVLGLVVFASYYFLRRQISSRLGAQPASYFFLLLICQFHLPFYASRPLPNTFALALSNVAYGFWLQQQPHHLLRTLVFAFVVFRCDLLPLIGTIGLSLLITRTISFSSAFLCCAIAGVISLTITIAVDSVMWGRLLWPEGSVLFFNTALNKSSDWGVSSFHWYFTSALPRSLLAALPLSLAGPFLDRRITAFFIPAAGFVLLYSYLPHKELRFLFPALPLFNLSAACALAHIKQASRNPSLSVARWALLASRLALMASVAASLAFASASFFNYPGGTAGLKMHEHAAHLSLPPLAHIHTLPAMTGFSRFSQLPPPWQYSKEEGLLPSQLAHRNFSYLLSAHDSVPGYEHIQSISSFSRFRIARAKLGPIRLLFPQLELHPMVHILQRTGAQETQQKPSTEHDEL